MNDYCMINGTVKINYYSHGLARCRGFGLCAQMDPKEIHYLGNRHGEEDV